MGHQIVKQPNGRYMVWSTVVDHVVQYNHTKETLIDYYIEDEKKRVTKIIGDVIDELEAGEKPYFQFTKSYEDCLSTIEIHHGSEELETFISKLNE